MYIVLCCHAHKAVCRNSHIAIVVRRVVRVVVRVACRVQGWQLPCQSAMHVYSLKNVSGPET